MRILRLLKTKIGGAIVKRLRGLQYLNSAARFLSNKPNSGPTSLVKAIKPLKFRL
jgi:hypothetical protein